MLAGKLSKASVAIVTGAGQGLGKAIALSNAALSMHFRPSLTHQNFTELTSHGYSVVLGDLPSSQHALSSVQQECSHIHNALPGKTGLGSLHVTCDVTIEEQVNALVDTAVNKFGKLDVMVANAGIFKMASLLELPSHDLDSVFNVNVKGLLLSYRAAARAMIPTGGGRIIGACSAAGKFAVPLFGAYCASKAAVQSITHTAAKEWGPHGITVNAYAPGPINTNMWLKDVMGGNESHPIDDMVFQLTPTARKTTSEQVASLVSYLVSPAAQNITGQCIAIDGGITMS